MYKQIILFKFLLLQLNTLSIWVLGFTISKHEDEILFTFSIFIMDIGIIIPRKKKSFNNLDDYQAYQKGKEILKEQMETSIYPVKDDVSLESERLNKEDRRAHEDYDVRN